MEYANSYRPRQLDRNRTPRLTFNLRMYVALLGFLAFALLYVAVGIRWHTYRARASLYAQQEMKATFQADAYLRLARNPGFTADAPQKAVEYRRLHKMYAKVAAECTRLRELYEQAW